MESFAGMESEECIDEEPLCDSCDKVDSRTSAAYAIGSAVQGAFNETGGVVWYDGRVVRKTGCSVTVRFNADGIEETYSLPREGGELRAMPSASVVGGPPQTGKRRSEREAAGQTEVPEDAYGNHISESEWREDEDEGSEGDQWEAQPKAKRRRRTIDGARSCPHGRQKSQCKECGGSAI